MKTSSLTCARLGAWVRRSQVTEHSTATAVTFNRAAAGRAWLCPTEQQAWSFEEGAFAGWPEWWHVAGCSRGLADIDSLASPANKTPSSKIAIAKSFIL